MEKKSEHIYGKENEVRRHPSFGMIRFSRFTGGGKKYFGSDVNHQSGIQLEIYEGEVTNTLTKEWFSPANHRPIVKLRLTTNQFSELITNMNVNYGVPCTLEFLNEKAVEDIPSEMEHRKDFIQRQFRNRMKDFSKEFSESFNTAKDTLEKKTLSKEDKKSILWAFEKTLQELTKNIPFFLECFQENSDKLSLEAKQEVENFVSAKIMQFGLEKLEDLKLLKDQ